MVLAAFRSKAVVLLLLIHCLLLLPLDFLGGGGGIWSLAFGGGGALSVVSSFAIIPLVNRELVALLYIPFDLM